MDEKPPDTGTSDLVGCSTCVDYERDLTECFHGDQDANGTPCEDTHCLETHIATATCGLNATDPIQVDECIISQTGGVAAVQMVVEVGPGGCSSEPTVQWSEFAVLGLPLDDAECQLQPLREACLAAPQDQSCQGVVVSVNTRLEEFQCN